MLFIRNGRIRTMAGPDIENGCILIGDDGKIVSVGCDITPPSAARVIDAGGRLVTPGCVEAHCHVGVSNPMPEVGDHNEKIDPITPQMRIIDGFNPNNKQLKIATQSGITTVCTGPGSANIIGGTFGAFKTAGSRADDMVIKHPIAMKCAFGYNPKKVYGGMNKAPYTRMGTAALLRDFLQKCKHYLEAKENGNPLSYDSKMEAMIPVLKKEIPLKAHAHRTDDIFTAIRIAREFDLRMTIDHCTDGHLIADALAKEGFPVLAGPAFYVAQKSEVQNVSFSTPAVLHNAGVSVSIITDASVTPIRYLPLCAGLAVAEGLPLEEGWKAITINPATHTGIADRVGSLEPGKDGDVVIWTADPLIHIGGKAYTTIINGNVEWQA
ncbi:MAG: amidohydrolase [Oscillospiraceae bacterium]|nr:amidohydrolase [Oscillospiraceae bacterium]